MLFIEESASPEFVVYLYHSLNNSRAEHMMSAEPNETEEEEIGQGEEMVRKIDKELGLSK